MVDGKDTAQPECLLGVTAIKPPERHGWEAVRYAIHDPDKGEFLGRTPKSWFLITVFYCIYYTCLAAFWYGMLTLFFMTIDTKVPKYTLDASIIGSNPGVGMRPQQSSENIDSAMVFIKSIAYNEKPSAPPFDTPRNVDWAKRYEVFLNKYSNTSETRACNSDDLSDKGKDACQFDQSALGECANYPYGYESEHENDLVAPCILLKINRIFDWSPEPYTADDLKYDDAGIPDRVKELAKNDPNRIYLNCEGENAADKEALEGNMRYFPANQGISYKYFPYTQSGQNYHNPVVAVKFENMPVGQLVHIECKMWARGMRHSRKFREGQVHFEILLN